MTATKRFAQARAKRKPADDLIRQIREDALRRILQPAPPPETWAPGELWPNESLDPENPGRFLLAARMVRSNTV